MSQPTPNRDARERERLEAISALERGPATPVVSPVPPTAKRIEELIELAESLFKDVFECAGYGHDYANGCGNCMNTGINASHKEEYDFAVALHDLVTAGRRYREES